MATLRLINASSTDFAKNVTIEGNKGDNAQFRFDIPASSGGNHQIVPIPAWGNPAASLTLSGDFYINTTLQDAAPLTTGTWQLENHASLSGAYGSTFQVVDDAGNPWTDAGGNQWTKTVGAKLYTFAETDGTLTLTEFILRTGAVLTVR